MPWVRLHGVKDYLDMVEILEKFPLIHLTFNLVPSLIEQIEDYTQRTIKDKFWELSYKPATELTETERKFILDNFFKINKERVISLFPRYYELYLKKLAKKDFISTDYLDLQVWFNLSWIDPDFRNTMPELKRIVEKARFFSEGEKGSVLDKQITILENIIPAYKKFMHSNQIELTVSPHYHPILPLLYNTKIAKEANPKTVLPKIQFSFPEDVKTQLNEAVKVFQSRFDKLPQGMWPSEAAVSEHILPFIIEAGINWIVTDEAILFKSLRKKKRDASLLYQPYLLKRKDGNLQIIFRDKNLSDLISFQYYRWETQSAVDNLLEHLKNIADTFSGQDILVTIAMDGENAWEYYPNDGHDFLELLYQKLSQAEFLKTVTISEYLKGHPANLEIRRLACGSWIFGEFGKWISSPKKARAWEYLALARKELEKILSCPDYSPDSIELAKKQIYILEGSDWFWWLGEEEDSFDKLFRLHLANFYAIIGKGAPQYLKEQI